MAYSGQRLTRHSSTRTVCQAPFLFCVCAISDALALASPDWDANDMVLFHNRGVLHSVVGAFKPDEVRCFHQCNLAGSSSACSRVTRYVQVIRERRPDVRPPFDHTGPDGPNEDDVKKHTA